MPACRADYVCANLPFISLAGDAGKGELLEAESERKKERNLSLKQVGGLKHTQR